jgi:hypothetical protein
MNARMILLGILVGCGSPLVIDEEDGASTKTDPPVASAPTNAVSVTTVVATTASTNGWKTNATFSRQSLRPHR